MLERELTCSLCYTYGDKPALYHAKQWLSYASLIRVSGILADIVKKNARTNAPICVLGDFSSIKCGGSTSLFLSDVAILGLVSMGRSVVFVTQDQQPSDILHILDEQHCEVMLVKHSRLQQLEEALQCSYCSSLRVVLYTDDAYIEKSESSSSYLAEDSLVETHDLRVLSLSHVIMTEYADYGRCFSGGGTVRAPGRGGDGAGEGLSRGYYLQQQQRTHHHLASQLGGCFFCACVGIRLEVGADSTSSHVGILT